MLPSIDAFAGQKYEISYEGERIVATFIKSKPDGSLVFERQDRNKRWYCPRKIFISLRVKGFAKRLNENDDEATVIEPGALEPYSDSDSKVVRRRKRKYRKAMTDQYYVIGMDKLGIPRSNTKIRAFIKDCIEDHERLKLEKAPASSTLIELYRTCGKPGHRPLHYFVSGSGGDHRSKKWHKVISDLKTKMIEDFYRPGGPHDRVARTRFREKAFEARAKLAALGEASFKIPSMSLLNDWLKMAATPENVARREGRRIATAQSRAIHSHAEAIRPLECVVLDHTQIDMFVVVRNAEGEITEICRPYLVVVIDVFSRMILAANLSLKPPSLESLMVGVKETLVPKEWLETQYGFLKGATDGWGEFYLMLVDNGLENIGISLQSMGQAVGLDILFAPVKTPEYKSIGERFFQTLNSGVWHPAKGGVPYKPDVMRALALDPQKEAVHTLDQAQDMLWNWVVTVYHLREHSELGKPPTRSWLGAGKDYTRPFVDDINLIDNVFGVRKTRSLTRAGIFYENETYFDENLVNNLFDDLSTRAKKKTARGKRQTLSIEVEIVVTQDASFVIVYNPTNKSYVRLPNVDGDNVGTFKEREAQRLAEKALNEAHYPEERLAVNEARHYRLTSGLTTIQCDPFIRIEEAEPVEQELAPGIIQRRVPSSHHGMERLISSPHAPAVHERGVNQPMRTGVARGGAKTRSKAKKTAEKDSIVASKRGAPKASMKAKSTDRQDLERQVTPVPVDDPIDDVAAFTRKNPFAIDDHEAFRADHEAELRRRMSGS